MKTVRIKTTKAMSQAAWEREGKPTWWVRYTTTNAYGQELTTFCNIPKTPGHLRLDAEITLPDEIDLVIAGVGKLPTTRVREKIRANRIVYKGGVQ